MRISKILAGMMLGIGVMGCELSAPDVTLETQNEKAEAIIQPWISDSAPGVAIAVSRDGDIVFAKGAGLASLEHDVDITPNSVFQVASLSKQFTAFAIALLVSEGQISLEDDIRQYLPDVPETDRIITIEHLLDHTGGLREKGTLASMAGWLLDDIHTNDQMLKLIRQQRGVNFAAGTDVEYSNTGYMLLARIVETVSETSFQEFMRSRIFEPLGMNQSHFVKSRADLIPGLAGSYSKSGEAEFKPIILENEIYGSTGLYTTALDLHKWADNFQTQNVGNEGAFALMAQRNIASNGEAATLAKGQEMRIYNGLETWSHGGRDGGYRSFLLRVPSENFAISILSNRADFDTAKMAYALVDAFLDGASGYDREEKPEWTPATKEELSAFAGDYEIYPGSMFSILTDGKALRIGSLGDSFEAANVIEQIAAREFMLYPSSDISLRFHAPEAGYSPGIDYQIGLHGALPVKRLSLKPFDKTTVNREDYTGLYVSEELGVDYWITIEDDALKAHHLRHDSFSLTPYQTDIFSGQGPLPKLEFTRDDDGRVNGFLASAPLSNNIRFERK